MTIAKTARCPHSQVKRGCSIPKTPANCRECLYIEIDIAHDRSIICHVCGAERQAYLTTMLEPCWYGHGALREADPIALAKLVPDGEGVRN